MEFNRLSVLAYSDKTEQTARVTWRGFLSFFLANLLQLDPDETDVMVGSSIARAIEELEVPETESIAYAIRHVSSQLAASLGMSPDFGLAAMLEGNPPTRMHFTPGRKVRIPTQDQFLTAWVAQLDIVQEDPEFSIAATEWRDLLEAAMIREGEAAPASRRINETA